MKDERMHVVETNRNGQETFLFMLDGKQFATVRHRRFRSRVFFVRSYPALEVDPPPAGQCWMLPLREIMVAIADVRKRLRPRNKEGGGTQYIVGDPRLVDRRVVLTIRLGDDLDAVIHKSGYRKQVRFPRKKQGKNTVWCRYTMPHRLCATPCGVCTPRSAGRWPTRNRRTSK